MAKRSIRHADHDQRVDNLSAIGFTARVRSPLRLACLLAAALAACVSGEADACSPIPLPTPPPRAAAETEAEFSARSDAWYREMHERERKEALPGLMVHEDRLWASAARIVLARVTKVGSIRLRGSENQLFESPLVTLKPIRWLKGNSAAKWLKVRYLSDDSCDSGGGSAPEGQVGETYLLFYRPGMLTPVYLLDSIGAASAVTQRTRDAFELR